MRTFLTSSSPLFEEPVSLLRQEVREPASYNSIISAIAAGASRISEISTESHVDSNACAIYLRTLLELGLMLKERPYGEKTERKSLYRIADNMFRFWYQFVLPNSSLIERGGTQRVYDRIAPQFPHFMGQIFEQICHEYLWLLLMQGDSPLEFNSLGRW